MKKIYLLVLVVFAVVSCQKDPVDNNGRLRLTVEGMHGATKMAVDKNLCYWVTGDTVLINNDTFTVNVVSGEDATVESKPSGFPDAPYYGVYPARICSSLNLTTGSCELNIPARYTYATTSRGTRTLQKLRVPMVAYTTNGPNIEFKHVTGALNVIVINHYGFTIQVDSIVVSSNKYQLCGSKTVTLGNTSLEVDAEETDNAALRRVSLIGDPSLTVLAGDTAIIQVPVLPVGSENLFTVEVEVHKVDQHQVKKTFSKTQEGGYDTDYALDRAEIGYVPTKFGGLFTVSGTGNNAKKVIISQGNLQYNKTTGEWSFMTTQYGTVETASQDVGKDYASQNIVSLFGWGTSGWNNGNYLYLPYKTGDSYGASKGYGFGPKNGSSYVNGLTGNYKNSDWGVYNKISNGGDSAGRWRTMTGNPTGEIYYMLYQRTTETSGLPGTNNGNAKFIKGKIGTVCGLFIFPDNYSHPSDISLITSSPVYNQRENTYGYDRFIVTETNWYKMEALGVVFLPAAGYRDGKVVQKYGDYGVYWSSSTIAASTAYSLYVVNDGLSYYYYAIRRDWGCSVRLVRDIN